MKSNLVSRPIEILLVEDNPGDIDLIIEAFKEWNILYNLNIVADGVEAMDYLHGNDKQFIRPDIIMLDLNLPKKDGREILSEIKSDHSLKSIPVIVLSTSDADLDVMKGYSLGANCYLTKPMGVDNFIHIVGSIGQFWSELVNLPARDSRRSME